MDRAARSVVAVLEETQAGGGSGVVITPDGYGLTNFHVIAPLLEERRGLGGMSDHRVYPLRVLGVDPTGDLAMFKLDPTPVDDVGARDLARPAETKPPGREAATSLSASRSADVVSFHAAVLADSDAVQVGDLVFAMGNPFLLAEDYTPTTTFGIVSGIQRYQFGASGRNLVYTDCIQVDASINPGNSGGPLFDLQGRLIGINGRASFEQRGRVNVGLAYAISINQARRFIPGLRAGLLVEHGSLGATTVDLGYRRVVFEKMLDPSVAAAVGIQVGDRLLMFGGREIHTANQFLNVLGTYPAGWPVVVVFERDGQQILRRVRLERLPAEVPFEVDEELNHAETRRVLDACRTALGDWPSGAALSWKAERGILAGPRAGEVRTLEITESAAGNGEARWLDDQGTFALEIQYNRRTAQSRAAGGEWQNVGPADTARAHLWMIGRQALLASADTEQLKAWRFVGGDEYRGRIVDLLEFKAEAGALRVAIDPLTHLPVRMFWQSPEPPSLKNPPVEMEFEQYDRHGDVQLPMQIFTYVGGTVATVDKIESYTLKRP